MRNRSGISATDSELIVGYTDDFKVTWSDPSWENESWIHDGMHAPWAQPPLTQAVFRRIMAIAFEEPTVFVNGYAFMLDHGPPPPPEEVEVQGPMKIWVTEYEPHVRLSCRDIRGRDYEALTTTQLVDRLPQYFDEAAEVFRYTMALLLPLLRPTASLISFLEKEMGDESGQFAARLLQGFENDSTAAGAGIDMLVKAAEASPAIRETLVRGKYDAIATFEGGGAFLKQLRDYIGLYGWRTESWYTFHTPTWAEDETLLLALVGRYLAEMQRDTAAAFVRSSSVREEAIREAEATLSKESIARFRELLQACNTHVSVSESRVRWQLEICGSIRVPILTLGRRLAGAGVIEVPNDIFFLSLDEIREAVRGESPSLARSVALSKEEVTRWGRLTPPAYLGVPPLMSKAPPDLRALMRHLRGYGVERSNDPERINGTGASKGLARGRARVINSLEDGSRLQPGDILVCRTTAPPWTALFTIAAGIVTDAGGILSHTAICAREYGIPAVVATQIATEQIVDGTFVTVDGDKGTVMVERNSPDEPR